MPIMKKNILIGILFLFISTSVFAQDVKNIRVAQDGNRVNVRYDLVGLGELYKVDLFLTTDEGKSWIGPLKSVSGDIGSNITTGFEKQIFWDVTSVKDINEGFMQFKVVAQIIEFSSKGEPSGIDIKKYKTIKTISLVTAIASAGTGVFTYLQSNKLYDEYKSAESDPSDLRSKIETYDKIYPIAFAIAGVSTVTFIIYSRKLNKAKKTLSFQPIPLKNGGGLTLTYNF